MTDPFDPTAEYSVPFEDELKDRHFNEVIDMLLKEGTVSMEDWEGLTQLQLAVVNTIRRAFARITAHANKPYKKELDKIKSL